MTQILIATGLSLLASGLDAAKNLCNKPDQIIISIISNLIWIVEYTLVFYSPAYIIELSVVLIYFSAYHFRSKLRRVFKMDISFLLLILLFILGTAAALLVLGGADIAVCIGMIFLEMFSVYMFTAQGLRFQNAALALMDAYLDFSVGNYIIFVMNIIIFIVAVAAIIKNRCERLLDREEITENAELVRLSAEIRRMKNNKL